MKKILMALILVTVVIFSITACTTETDAEFTVTFDADGGSTVASQTVTSGETATEPEAPTKEGYTFEGWFVGDTAYDFDTAVTADVTLKAKWTIKSYSVTFDADNGSDNTTATIAHGSKVTAPVNPAKEGYTFEGWFVGDTAYDFEAAVTADVALKAKWTLNSYKVTFDADNGTENTTATVDHGAVVTAPADPAKDGYTFAGWFVGETAYDLTTPVTADVTLKAKWTINSYTVIFNADNGTENTSASIEHGSKVTAPTAPTKDGYTFDGWYLDTNAYDFETAVTGNITLKAKWTLNSYTVTFDADNGTNKTTATVNHGDKAQKPADPTKDGYTFGGWYLGTNAYDFNTAVKGDVALKAAWTINTYTVTFDTNGGSEIKSVTVNHGDKVQKPADPTKPGFALESWKNGETVYDFNTPVTGNVTLKAEWKVDLPDLTAIAGTWTGKEQVVNTTTSYEFVIAADGNITATYSSGYSDITLTINYVIFENNKLTINYNTGTTTGANLVFTLSEDKGVLSTAAGVMGTELSLYKNYTVTFDWGNYKNNESEVDPSVKTVVHGNKISAPSKSWTGYEIKGWFVNGEEFDLSTTPVTSDMTLVAKWGQKEYTVTYYKQDGTVLKVVTVKHGESVPASEVPTEGITTVEGSVHNGFWYGTAKSNIIVDVVGKAVTSAKNCYPGIIDSLTELDGTWKGTKGTDAWEVVINAADKKVSVMVNGVGQTVAWFRFQELDGKVQFVVNTGSANAFVYDSEAGTLNGGTSSKPLVLTKQGQQTYTVTFDSDGGSAVAPLDVVKDATVEEPTAPTKDGVVFDGWYLGDVKYDFATPVTGDITLTAKWKSVAVYNVTFNTGNASTTTTQEVVEGECVVAPNEPTKSGYKFMGWYDGDVKFDLSTPVTSDLTLEVKWGCEVIFYNQSKEAVKTIIVENGKPIPASEIPEAQINEDFVFTGTWHKGSSVSAAPVDIEAPVSGTLKLYPGVLAESVTDLEGTWVGEKDGEVYSVTIDVLVDENGKVTGATASFINGDVSYDVASVQYGATLSSYMQFCIKYYKTATATAATSFMVNLYEDGTVKLGSPSIVLTKQA